jgi:surface antigen
VPRTRHFQGIRVVRAHGRSYFGYGFFYTDGDAYKWLAFTAITLTILDNLNEEQQRLHEAAQVRATKADVDETIVWEDSGASGSVKTIRIGKSTSGRQCREFQQSISIGGKTEQAYGIACLQPDGAWEIVQ